MKRFSVRQTVLAGLFSALMAVFSQVALPLPGTGVPLTLQTFGVALCGFICGPLIGSCALGTYLLLGAVGIPVFSHFKGGVATFLGPTGGFLWGFLLLVFFCGLGGHCLRRPSGWLLSAFGLLLCHISGAFQYALISGIGLWPALLSVSLPFLFKDGICVVLAGGAASVLRRISALRL